MDTATALTNFEYGTEGFRDTVSSRAGTNSFSRASRNLIPDDDNVANPFKGLSYEGDGARLMFLAGENTWGGLADNLSQQAAGSLFSWFADMLVFVGAGKVVYDGTEIPTVTAQSLVQFLLKWNGSYTHANSGPFIAGIPQPSAPTSVGLVDTTVGGTPVTNGLYSIKIAWIRSTTGGRSVASATSVPVNAVGKGLYAVIPDAPDGVTHLVVFITKRNFGGQGLHYRCVRANPWTGIEYTVDDIQRSITDLSVANASPIVTSASTPFTQADQGKRFNPVSAGFTVPAGTTVLTVDSASQITLSNNVTVASGTNPRTAELIIYTNSLDRSILLNWQESDLIDEVAWIEDYEPPTASHVFPLEKVLGIITQADASDSASGGQGTVAQFSLRNLPESFNPLHKLFLPTAVVDVLHRGVDSFVFISSPTFTGAIQFIDIYDSAPATLTSLLPDEGIAHRNNWCISDDGVYLFTAKGSAKCIGPNGVVDKDFSLPVRRFMKEYFTDITKVIVARWADGNSIAYIYENFCCLFNTQTRLWSPPIYFQDFHSQLETISALGVNGKLLISGNEDSIKPSAPGPSFSHLLFEFNNGTGAAVSAIPHYTEDGSLSQTKAITHLIPKFNTDVVDTPVYITVHTNDEQQYITDAEIDAGDNELRSASSKFDSSHIGKYVLIAGASGGNLYYGRIKSVTSATAVEIGTPERILSDSVNKNATTTVANAYCVIAHRIFEIPSTKLRVGENRPKPLKLLINGLRSYAVGIVMDSDGTGAVPLSCQVQGVVNPETTWKAVQ